jgi:hypothetical protein
MFIEKEQAYEICAKMSRLYMAVMNPYTGCNWISCYEHTRV